MNTRFRFQYCRSGEVGRYQQFTAKHGNMRAAAVVYDSTLAIIRSGYLSRRRKRQSRLAFFFCCMLCTGGKLLCFFSQSSGWLRGFFIFLTPFISHKFHRHDFSFEIICLQCVLRARERRNRDRDAVNTKPIHHWMVANFNTVHKAEGGRT